MWDRLKKVCISIISAAILIGSTAPAWATPPGQCQLLLSQFLSQSHFKVDGTELEATLRKHLEEMEQKGFASLPHRLIPSGKNSTIKTLAVLDFLYRHSMLNHLKIDLLAFIDWNLAYARIFPELPAGDLDGVVVAWDPHPWDHVLKDLHPRAVHEIRREIRRQILGVLETAATKKKIQLSDRQARAVKLLSVYGISADRELLRRLRTKADPLTAHLLWRTEDSLSKKPPRDGTPPTAWPDESIVKAKFFAALSKTAGGPGNTESFVDWVADKHNFLTAEDYELFLDYALQAGSTIFAVHLANELGHTPSKELRTRLLGPVRVIVGREPWEAVKNFPDYVIFYAQYGHSEHVEFHLERFEGELNGKRAPELLLQALKVFRSRRPGSED